MSLASEDSPAGRPASTAAAAGWIAGAAVFLVSVLGLLCLRMDFFDDSAMVLGARLVRAGKLPYLDFYTYYGPLGFSLLGGFLSLRVNPGVAFRVAQSCGLLVAAILLWVLARRFRAATGPGFLVALALLALSAVFQLPAFFGFLFAFAAAGLFLLSGTAQNRNARTSLVVAAAAGLAAAALTRPIFGVYALAPVLVAAVVDEIDRTGHASRRAVSLLVGGGLLWTFLLWIVLYARIPARIAIDAALIEPAKLVEGGGRFLRPSFFPFVPTGLGRGLATFCGGAVILGASAAWALNLPSRRSRRAMAAVCFAGGVGSVLLALSPAPGRHATLLALAAFLLVAGLTWVCRSDLRGSGAASAAAFFGVFSAAFGHYFWQRPDRPHLIPLLALSAVALLLSGADSRPRERAAGLVVLILAYVSVWEIPWTPFPLMHLANRGIPRIVEHAKQPGATWKTLWPAGELPLDAATAVSLADRYGGAGSRFVAVGSSQAWSSGNPVLLFLLSARAPYTRWWAYDPGVQSSPAIQREMWREIQQSGSRTAVVWRAEGYLFERGVDLSRRTPFDDSFDRLYPIRGPRFGLYELRLRASSSPGGAAEGLSSEHPPATERTRPTRR